MSGTTTNYGWTYPTSTDYVKDGASAVQTLATGIDTTSATTNLAGLVLIKTQTIGSAVSSVTVSNAFSTTYDNYKIIVGGGVGSVAQDLALRLGASTSGYDQILLYGNYSTDAAYGNRQQNWSSIRLAGYGDTTMQTMNVELFAPYKTAYTTYNASYIGASSFGTEGGVHKVAASYTDFTIIPGAGTMTGGTIAVYGYRKAI